MIAAIAFTLVLTAESPVGSVLNLKGGLAVVRKGVKLKGASRMPVYAGDRLQLGRGSSCRFAHFPSGVVYVATSSVVAVNANGAAMVPKSPGSLTGTRILPQSPALAKSAAILGYRARDFRSDFAITGPKNGSRQRPDAITLDNRIEAIPNDERIIVFRIFADSNSTAIARFGAPITAVSVGLAEFTLQPGVIYRITASINNETKPIGETRFRFLTNTEASELSQIETRAEEVRTRNPKDATVDVLLAHTYTRLGFIADAVQAWERVRSIQPDLFDAAAYDIVKKG